MGVQALLWVMAEPAPIALYGGCDVENERF